MIISAEVMVNPGQNALFMAEMKLERNQNITPNWWGLWFSWWLYPARRWREWVWEWKVVRDPGWFTWQVRLLGFEINWQLRKGRY